MKKSLVVTNLAPLLVALALFFLFYSVCELAPTVSAFAVFLIGVFYSVISVGKQRAEREAYVDAVAEDLRRMSFGKSTSIQSLTKFPDLHELSVESKSIIQQLSARLNSILRKKDESDAVLASMSEGVIAVDSEARILTINEAAQKLLRISVTPHTNPNVEEVLPNSKLPRIFERILEHHRSIEEEIMLEDEDNTILQIKGSALKENTRGSIGAVVVFHDMTQLRKLETVRRDFVANVSHELKTPITSIKGFVETLIDGALDIREDAERFLLIVSRQADRLTAIIDDLLALSRLEQEDSSQEVIREPITIHELVDSSCQACQLKGEEKSITFIRDLEDSMLVQVNAHLIEQALINLITNAIKYSSQRGKVLISAQSNGKDAILTVQDYGIGIPKKDLPRLFERFYRVDRARSRKMGGTGLGLAIVKHIAHAHEGFVRVESEVNVGSTFYIHLPGAVISSSNVRNLHSSESGNQMKEAPEVTKLVENL